MEKATFGAGCFWGVESFFREVAGVIDAVAGYAGGAVDNPTYKQVCTDTTGHAEVVQVTFDPTKVSYERLLDIFFMNHDPTTLNRQGPDFGSQYRSVIFTHSPEQAAAAEAKKAALTKAGKFKRPIVTAIEPFRNFYRAEEYHQRYFEKNGLPSCHVQMPEAGE
jgi:peptide-methionine (S)-S-oxide reductase